MISTALDFAHDTVLPLRDNPYTDIRQMPVFSIKNAWMQASLHQTFYYFNRSLDSKSTCLLDDCSNTSRSYCTSTFTFSVILNCTVFSCFWFLHLLIFSIFYCFYDFFQINVAKMLPFTIKT